MGCFVITKYLFSIHLVDICVSFRKLKLLSSVFALLFTEISVVWFTEISVVWVTEISVKSRAKAEDTSLCCIVIG